MAKDRIASITFIAIATSFIVIVSLISSLPEALAKDAVTSSPYLHTTSGIVPQSVTSPPRNSVPVPSPPHLSIPHHHRDHGGYSISSSKQVDRDLQFHQLLPPPPPS